MDFIGSCEGRWQRNRVAQPEDRGAGLNAKTHHQVNGSNGNGEMREKGGGVVRCEYHPPSPFILPRLYMQVEDFHSAGVKLMLGDVFS